MHTQIHNLTKTPTVSRGVNEHAWISGATQLFSTWTSKRLDRLVQPFALPCRHSDLFVYWALTTSDERKKGEEKKSFNFQVPFWNWPESTCETTPGWRADTESLTPPSPDLPLPLSLGYYIFSLNLTFRCLPACVLKTSAGTTRSAPTSTQPHLHEAPTCWWSWRGVALVFSNDAAFASRGVIRYQTQSCGAEPTLLLHSFTLCPARGVHGLLPVIACDFRVFG